MARTSGGKPATAHYPRPGGLNRTLCGRVILRYDSAGALASELRVTPHPHQVSCQACRNHPDLDSALGNMTHTGH